jgi:hypothetical protein
MWRAIACILFAIAITVAPSATGSSAAELAKHVSLLRVSPADQPGFARTETNATSITRSSLVTSGNYQFCAYYDSVRPTVVLARRDLESKHWEVLKTDFTANELADSHDAISMGIDGKGRLHLSWGMHSQRLKYAKTTSTVTGSAPFRPKFGPIEPRLPGQAENIDSFERVTYPEFYNILQSDNLILTYRSGSSGNGNQYMSSYDASTNTWSALQPPGIAVI